MEMDMDGEWDMVLLPGEFDAVLGKDDDRESAHDFGLVRLLPPLLVMLVLLLPTKLLLPPSGPVVAFLDLITRGGCDEHRPPSCGVPMMKTVSRS